MKYLFLFFLCLSNIFAQNEAAPTEKDKNLQRFDELTKVILEGSFKERKVAVEEIYKLDIDIGVIEDRLKNTNDPELKLILSKLLSTKSSWTIVNPADWGKYPVYGINNEGEPLYLVKSTYEENIVIGKASSADAGFFPFKGKEYQIKEFQIWNGPAEFRKWEKNLPGMKPIGVNKEGKKIYAARARLKNAILLGTYEEGKNRAIFPSEGISHSIGNFEVMVEPGTSGDSMLTNELSNKLKNLKSNVETQFIESK